MANVDNDVAGRLVLITGASGGIGSACARQFASLGCHLALTYSSNRESIEKLVKELQPATNGAESKQRFTIHQADLSSPEQTTKLCEEVQKEHNSAVSILISNAGYGKRIRDVSDIPLSEFEITINVNLRAPFLLVKGVVDGMKAQKWGRIIFVSSIAAHGGGMNGCHYAASKGGTMGMMKNLSTTLAPYNIAVNDVAPAMVGNTGLLPNGDQFPGLVNSIPMQRLCEPEEVANAVVFYAKTGFTTGQSLIIAGGLK
ncbi:3-oxoacyl-[acyl-carrier-protein] reductase FabG [Fulvia fulva]|uniref:3-oxoacyl-[acyl-carrier-protein] reductase FabG n=1 Tax=Passalora fulva TaxID=5499 RepID=A0A9Q8LHN1_PASFU|nr:3-oxoacyl-[acyl-carrier-protein] reductase FabG [Fulvia fulva]KAK4624026.1 3-oxoacyl-[acyl-carrier-protein] reductase FabG [Fulvia fulva]KAK4625950.1 3-oxoacyl-[acyl-carrier-protein] reductase FabG [Fulvia fulva]UJO17629.1 3-oxoacyl-[acyl-carrier-protein] reductase FabG [Fulvia fulva]WPV15329.1 3-oxoacyl-[acyl-carrier-protein] reductase FabG [Fulvia fulva]WPV29940.1 3-oxoacyl-[acyl-carrier-protein] reductase FabG [Fulvia fulva]